MAATSETGTAVSVRLPRGSAPRRLPDDATLCALVTSGEFYAEIARRYAVTDDAVRKHARRLGFAPIPPGQRQGRRDSRVDW